MKKAFTLIEFLIYMAILATILVLMSGFFWNIIFGNIKETSYQEVQQNGRFALTKITQEIKKATGIIVLWPVLPQTLFLWLWPMLLQQFLI